MACGKREPVAATVHDYGSNHNRILLTAMFASEARKNEGLAYYGFWLALLSPKEAGVSGCTSV
jgi:hypothetical protein